MQMKKNIRMLLKPFKEYQLFASKIFHHFRDKQIIKNQNKNLLALLEL